MNLGSFCVLNFYIFPEGLKEDLIQICCCSACPLHLTHLHLVLLCEIKDNIFFCILLSLSRLSLVITCYL